MLLTAALAVAFVVDAAPERWSAPDVHATARSAMATISAWEGIDFIG
jgi:hypothetical protein